MTRERELLGVESALSVRLPRSLFAEGALPAGVDPEALLDAEAGVIHGGRMPPDTLPYRSTRAATACSCGSTPGVRWSR